jgi:hypothetical protein
VVSTWLLLWPSASTSPGMFTDTATGLVVRFRVASYPKWYVTSRMAARKVGALELELRRIVILCDSTGWLDV